MERYKTNAKKASQEIDRMSKNSKSLPSPWSHLDSQMNSIVLETTIDELSLYWDIKTYLRPGYSSNGQEINIPILFSKINGFDDKASNILFEIKRSPNMMYLERVGDLLDDSPYSGEVNLNDEKWIKSFVFSEFSYLNQHYQKKIQKAILDLENNKNDYLSEYINDINLEKLVQIISRIKTPILQKYNVNDFQYTTPKLILKVDDGQLDLDASIACFFLGMLGFDVVVINTDGYADIENYIHPNLINVFISKGTKAIDNVGPKPLAKRKKMLVKVGAVALAFVVGGTAINFGVVKSGLFTANVIEQSIEAVVEESVGLEVIPEVEEISVIDDAVEIVDNTQPVVSNTQDSVGNQLAQVDATSIEGFTFIEGELYRTIPTSAGEIPNSITSLESNYTELIEFYQVTSLDFNIFYDDLETQKLAPGMWLFLSQSKELVGPDNINYMFTIEKKLAIDGTKEYMNVPTGNSFYVDLLQKPSENSIVAKITDDYGNIVIPLVDSGSYHDIEFLEYKFTDESGNSQTIEIEDLYGYEYLNDGKYNVSIVNKGIASIVDFKLSSDSYIVENGVIMKDVPGNNSPSVLDEPITIDCNVDELLLINLEEIFTDIDVDDQELFVYTGSDVDMYEVEEGQVGPYYAMQINSRTRSNVVLYATDGKSPAVMKEIKLNIN